MDTSTNISGFSQTKLFTTIHGFRDTKKFCDVTLLCDGRRFYAHACVLAAASPYFMALFRSGMSEVETKSIKVKIDPLSGVSDQSMDDVIAYIYGIDIKVDIENIFDLLAIADYFLLAELKTNLADYLSMMLRRAREAPEWVFDSYNAAEIYGFKELYHLSFSCILKWFYTLSKLTVFNELSNVVLEDIISDENIAGSNREIAEVILKWVNHDQEKRQDFLVNLLDYVRFDDTLTQDDLNTLLTEQGFDKTLSYENRKQDDSIGRHVILAFNKTTSLCYVPLLDDWCTIEPLPEPRTSFKVVTLDNMVYIIGGQTDAGTIRELWSYNPERNKWKEQAPMLKTASSFGVAAVNGFLYAVGGPNCILQKYDPVGDYWSFAKPMCTRRDEHCAVALHNRYLFVIGGLTAETSSLYSVERYDTNNDSWQDMADLNIGRIESSAITVHDNILVVGGYGGPQNHEITSCEMYHSIDNTWSIIEPMCHPRRSPAIFTMYGNIYILGGTHKRTKHSMEYFCSEKKRWVEDKNRKILIHRDVQCCTVLLTGKAICQRLLNKVDKLPS